MAYERRRSISLLFDVFVLNQRLRLLTTAALAGAGMRADEYAVYSLLFELGPLTPTEMGRRLGMPLTTVLDYVRPMLARGHAVRTRHPRDGRSYRLVLTPQGRDAQQQTNRAWSVMLDHLTQALPVPEDQIQAMVQALDGAAATAYDTLLEAARAAAG